MDKSRMISISLMMITTMLVMMLVRSCMNNAQEAQNRNKAAASPTDAPHIVEDTIPGVDGDAVLASEETTEETTEQIEYITDLLGRVVGTVAPTEPAVPVEGETTTEEDTRNLLEKYNDEQASIAAENATAEELTGGVFGGRDPQLTTEIVLVIG